MRSFCAGGVAAAAVLSLVGCELPQQPPPPQQGAELSVPGVVPAQTAAAVPTPTPPTPPPFPVLVATVPPQPPPVPVQTVPASPGGGAVWQPGHWQWTGVTGSEWQWAPGQYVVPPTAMSQWVPGHWEQRPQGWVWVDGHWA